MKTPTEAFTAHESALTDEQKLAAVLTTMDNTISQTLASRKTGPPKAGRINQGHIERWKRDGNPLLGVYRRHVEAPRRARQAFLDGRDPFACLAELDLGEPEWLEQRKAELRDKWNRLRGGGTKPVWRSSMAQADPEGWLKIPVKYAKADLAGLKSSGTELTGLKDLLAIEQARPSVYVFGPNGVGKTWLSAALARRWKSVWFDAVDIVRVPVNAPSSSEGGMLLFRAIDTPSIVIDDIAAVRKTDTSLESLLMVLKKRDDAGRQTIANGHLLPSELEHIDSGLASRISSFGLVKMSGPDRRLERRAS